MTHPILAGVLLVLAGYGSCTDRGERAHWNSSSVQSFSHIRAGARADS